MTSMVFLFMLGLFGSQTKTRWKPPYPQYKLKSEGIIDTRKAILTNCVHVLLKKLRLHSQGSGAGRAGGETHTSGPVGACLCSHSPMFPQPYVPTFLRAFSKLGLMFPQLCVPTFLIFITKLGPMFLQFPHFYPCLVVKGSPFRSWRFEGAS